MGYSQFRKGPNKIMLAGLTQPFSDAMKLFSKGFQVFYFLKYYFFMIAPLFGLFLIVFMWIFFPSWYVLYKGSLETVLFFSVLGLMSYFLFFCGYGSSSNYSVIGYIRSVSQSISYEVCVIFFILVVVFTFIELRFVSLRYWERGLVFFVLFFPLFWVWLVLRMSESNRSPFDFSEGESELVSGFNVEYFGGLFSLIFITEYGIIIFMSFIGSLLFFGSLFLEQWLIILSFFYVWVRCSFPRFRYDMLMEMSWLSLMPIIISLVFFLLEYIPVGRVLFNA
jgi:NADH-ubiquinone oxidoreductase chain 1